MVSWHNACQTGPREQCRYLSGFWPFSQFLRGMAPCIMWHRGTVMSDMIDWIQSYWYELGNLALQFAILAVVVSYGRKALRILSVPLATSRAASQAQVELLQDLENLSETRGSRPAAEPKAAAYGGVGRMLSPIPEGPAGSQAEPAVLASREGISSWDALVAWLQAPMGNRPGPAWRRVIIRQVS